MFRFLPWKFIIKRAARTYGLADPALWLARIRSFAQPSEVQEPIELLRAGVLFHARGVVNTKAIQHNLDWVWPYWVERQFDPHDESFIPRAFSVSHVNLTHRNWTAIGLPELPLYPLVDPRGLVTPVLDGWSIDFWLFGRDGSTLIPSRLKDDAVKQRLVTENDLMVTTEMQRGDLTLLQSAYVESQDSEAVLRVDVHAHSPQGGMLAVSLRPCNPEGVQFIDHIGARQDRTGWRINDRLEVLLDRAADQLLVADYAHGDVFSRLDEKCDSQPVGDEIPESHRCKTGMATAASVYCFDGSETEISLRVPLGVEMRELHIDARGDLRTSWSAIQGQVAQLSHPDASIQYLYESAVATLILLSADEIIPGPYTYRRFWFRDACLMMNALLAIGLTDRCRRAIERFPDRQLTSGYFRSQEGEWDSNGQVLWILERFAAVTGESFPPSLLDAAERAVRWLDRTRVSSDSSVRHAGLLPAGFSAEHLGPNDHYYWDDYWAEGGLRAAECLFRSAGRETAARNAARLAQQFHQAIERSLEQIPYSRSQGGIPASPYRRLDAGAVGSLVSDYPLQLMSPGEPRVMATVEAILARHMVHGGFFQDVIHSGVNAYLTLDIAQTLLRAGDPRFSHLVEAVAELASPTGQWPEAIHPHTRGGCMGDGQHGWAAAEWVMMIRNSFVREEAERLILGSGLLDSWTTSGARLSYGPTATEWGPVRVEVECRDCEAAVRIHSTWRRQPPVIEVAVPCFERVLLTDESTEITVARAEQSVQSGSTPANP